MSRKVVYNDCYGGFGLSPLAVKRYYELKYPDVTLYFYKETYEDNLDAIYTKIKCPSKDSFIVILSKDLGDKFTITIEERQKKNHSQLYKDFNDNYVYLSGHVKRDDPVLVQVVEELEEKANGSCSKLEIIDIGDSKFHINEYDGLESVETQLSDDYWQ